MIHQHCPQIIQPQKVRFSGIPNNGTLELVELSQEEIGKEEKVIFGQRNFQLGEEYYVCAKAY